MFNIMLDRLPTEYEGYPIDTDFQIGIQIMQVLEDDELSQQEQIGQALSLLFITEDKDGEPLDLPDAQTAVDCLTWFLSAWNHDKHGGEDKEKVTDYDIDQWRIYSAFKQFYGINLNDLGERCVGYKIKNMRNQIGWFCDYAEPIYEPNKLHFWEFMALLTTLPECAYTRVVDIRSKKLDGKMSKEERNTYIKLKAIYELKQTKAAEYTDEQKQAIDEYDAMIEEQKRIRESQRLAEEAFENMTK